MAKHGLAVGDIAVVTKALAEARPELVARYVQAECAAITFWHDHPEETAQIVERELGVDPQEAARMMRGTGVLPCRQQLTSAYLGKEGNAGRSEERRVGKEGGSQCRYRWWPDH